MYHFNIFSLLSLLVAQIYFLLGIYVFARNPKETANRLFLMMALTMALWGLGEGMQRTSGNPETAYMWATLAGLGSSFHGTFLIHFWWIFSGEMTKKKKNILRGLYTISGISSLLFLTGKMITGTEEHYWGYSSFGGEIYSLFMLYVAIITIAMVIMTFRKAKRSEGKLKVQAIYIGIGVSIPLIIGIITEAMRPLVKLQIPELTVISTIFFIIIIAKAVSTYDMLTITTKMVAKNIIATMKDFVIAVDKDMKISVVNDAVLKSLNCKKADITGRPVNDFLDTEKLKNLKYEEILKQLPLSNYEADLKNKKIKIPVSANISAIKEYEDRPVGLAFVMRDMREMNKLIKELKEKKDEMEKKNIELEEKNNKLEEFNNIAIKRELRITELRNKLHKGA